MNDNQWQAQQQDDNELADTRFIRELGMQVFDKLADQDHDTIQRVLAFMESLGSEGETTPQTINNAQLLRIVHLLLNAKQEPAHRSFHSEAEIDVIEAEIAADVAAGIIDVETAAQMRRRLQLRRQQIQGK